MESLGNMAQFLAGAAAVIGALYVMFPRAIHVKDTHMGILFTKGTHKVLKPGWYWYWTLWSEPKVYPVKRTTLDLPTQTLVTKDNKTILVSAVIIYTVSDIEKAIVDTFDFENDTVNAARGAVKEVVTASDYAFLMEQRDVDTRLTRKVRSDLRSFGISVEEVFLSDFSPCKVLRLVSDSPTVGAGLPA